MNKFKGEVEADLEGKGPWVLAMDLAPNGT